jgi:RNA polymerase sigma-70 factor (ECF subfamily)
MTIKKIDAYIVERARAGDHEAFGAIFEEYGPAVAGYLFRLLNDREVARDLSQETFLKVYRGLPKLQLDQNDLEGREFNLSAWIFTIAHHNAMDYLRRKRRSGLSLSSLSFGWLDFGRFKGSSGGGVSLEERVEETEPCLLDEAERVALGDTVGRTLARLPKDQAACLILHYHQGFSYNEAAEILDVPLTTFKMRLYRARQAFQTAYREEMKEQSAETERNVFLKGESNER